MFNIIYLSESLKVSMTDEWFNIANLSHFWIERRFYVLKKILNGKLNKNSRVAEVGCGNGLVQCQIENNFGVCVDGFELNDNYLKKSIAKNHNLYCYDVLQRKKEFREKYDFIILFDVIEHIEKDNEFLDAVLFHLKKGGYVLINVPANQRYYSKYDEIAGHKRRYSVSDINEIAIKSECEIEKITYWGLSLLPLLILRKLYLEIRNYDHKKIIHLGFEVKYKVVNKLLKYISMVEPIPQLINGTSILAILKKNK